MHVLLIWHGCPSALGMKESHDIGLGNPEEERSLFRHGKQAVGDGQVQAAAVLCAGCEAAAAPGVCVAFNAVPALGERAQSQLADGGGDPHHPLSSPFSVLPSPQLLPGFTWIS